MFFFNILVHKTTTKIQFFSWILWKPGKFISSLLSHFLPQGMRYKNNGFIAIIRTRNGILKHSSWELGLLRMKGLNIWGKWSSGLTQAPFGWVLTFLNKGIREIQQKTYFVFGDRKLLEEKIIYLLVKWESFRWFKLRVELLRVGLWGKT